LNICLAIGALTMRITRKMAGLLLDPRGRMSRQDMLVAATLMLMIDMVLASLATGFLLYAVKGIAYWIGGVGIVKRLRDTGRTGWWLLGGLVVFFIWAAVIGVGMVFVLGLEPLHPGAPGYVMVLGLLMLPALGAALWLHLAEGERGMNRYGGEPEGVFAGSLVGSPAGESAASRR
jgi:uncharacterized membrane protein YhaH (DUF805 family)